MVVYFNTIDVQLIHTMKPVVRNEPYVFTLHIQACQISHNGKRSRTQLQKVMGTMPHTLIPNTQPRQKNGAVSVKAEGLEQEVKSQILSKVCLCSVHWFKHSSPAKK